MDEEAVMAMVEQTAGYMVGAAVATGIQLGDRLGLYGALASLGSASADGVAEEVGCHPRLVREWLDGQTAAGLITYDGVGDSYGMTEAAALVLANQESPVFLARGVQALGSLSADLDKIESAFRGDGGLAWGDHHQCLFDGVEWFFRPGYRANLVSEWLPALPGVAERLAAGATVADVGCGHGSSLIIMAQAFPRSTFVGIDFHAPSVEAARARASEAGVADRCTFVVADAQSYEGSFDLVCFFDCLHDMGDPVGAARHALGCLADEGTVLLVEPFALDGRVANIAENPIAALNYHASAMICTPNSLSQEVALGLGAQAGEDRLRSVVQEAGFSSLDRRTETAFNLILQASP